LKYIQIHQRNLRFNRIFPFVMYLLLFSFFHFNSCFSQITISGVLSDSTGAGIEYANVQIDAGKSYFLTSDSLGRFSQSIPGAGIIQIKVNRISYSSFDSPFSVYHDTTIIINLVKNLNNIREVVVTGKKVDISDNNIVISHRDLVLKPKMLGETDVLSILQKKTGIVHTSEVSPGLYVRGMQQGNTGIFFGGTELFGVNHILSIYPQFNSDAISNVSLLKTDLDARYGGYLSSVMLIDPDHQLYSKFAGSAELGILNAKLSFQVPVVNDRISAKLSLRRSYFDLIADVYNHNDKNKLPQYGFSEINGSVVFRTKRKGIFTLDIFRTNDKIIFYDNDISLSSDWKSYLITGSWKTSLSEKADFELLSGYTWFNLDVGLTNLFEHSINNTISQGNISANVIYRFSNTLKSETGADFKLNRIKLESSAADYNTGNNSPITWTRPAENATIYENIQWSPISDLRLKAGGRFEFYNSDTLYSDFIPFISATYQFYGYTINTGYSKQVQYKHLFMPTGINLPMNIWYPSQSDVPPEKARHYNVSVAKKIRNVKVSLSGYYIDMIDLTEFLDGNYFTSLKFTTDLGHGYSKGLETTLAWKTGNFDIEWGFTISKSRRKFPLVNEGTWFSPSFDIRHKTDINIIYRLGKNWVFTLSQYLQDGFITTLPTSIYIHQQGDYKTNSNFQIVPVYTTRYNFRMPNSHRMDISGSYSFDWAKTKAVFTFGVYNVYNYQNPYFIYFITQKQEDSSIILKPKKKSLLPFVPFASLKISF